jgi:hypothetical protein
MEGMKLCRLSFYGVGIAYIPYACCRYSVLKELVDGCAESSSARVRHRVTPYILHMVCQTLAS